MAAKSRRLNIVVPERTVQRLNDIKELTDASSISDVIRSAVLTYGALANWLSDGSVFYIKTPDGALREIDMMIDVPHRGSHLSVVTGSQAQSDQ